jgi:ech hydrogenase subunit D
MRETIETQEIKTISKADLLAECAAIAAKGMRMVQLLAVNSPDGVEMTYSFSKDFTMVSLRCNVPTGESVASITPVWKGAFLYENEIKDLYGVQIENINVDYHGKFYDVAKEKPFAAGAPKAVGEAK